ncbi:MAG: M14 family zinc carboxypeptidase [Henriciella sp.]|uniref:M14 family zinc carboxypeptidase n=1 Tax=Henriciella sp. TaxID=1968823 RepID=UPI003C759691
MSSAPAGGKPDYALCSGNGLVISAAFSGAGQHACTVDGADEATVSVMHERSTSGPINPSPWYAFAIQSAASRSVSLTLDYLDYEHRYTPYMSRDGGAWTKLGEGRIDLSDDEHLATVTLELPAGVTYVAAHPVFTVEQSLGAARALAGRHGLKEVDYGRSAEGRPLIAFEKGAEDADKIIIALTRQHPPELPGTAGYRVFLETLLAEAPEGFWDEHLLVAVPVANPDGVENGHWRLNIGGVDLNRDWYAQAQPEIAALTAHLKARADGKRAVAMFDFHSTWNTVIYTPPFENASPDAAFLPQLKARLDQPGCSHPNWKPGHRADSGTSKSWGLAELGAPALTVEFGDNEAVETISCTAAEIAREVIAYSRR